MQTRIDKMTKPLILLAKPAATSANQGAINLSRRVKYRCTPSPSTVAAPYSTLMCCTMDKGTLSLSRARTVLYVCTYIPVLREYPILRRLRCRLEAR
jgi:hypothetical protein